MEIRAHDDAGIDNDVVATHEQVVAVMNSAFVDYRPFDPDSVTPLPDEGPYMWTIPVPQPLWYIWDDNPDGTTTTANATIDGHNFTMFFRP